MSRLMVSAVLGVLLVVPGWSSGQEAAKRTAGGLAGDWEGALAVTPRLQLRITLRVAAGKDGSLSGTWGSPDEGLEGLPLGSIALKGDDLTFATKHGVTYRGTRKPGSDAIVGRWTQSGRDFPVTFKRFDPARVAAAPPIPKELEGLWEGKLKVTAGMELRLVLKVEKGKDGTLKAVLASPDQGANSIPISAIELKDGTLSFESKIIGAKFSGKTAKDGKGFDGSFTQGGLKMPLELRKTEKVGVLSRPQTPKPPFPYRSLEVTYENRAGGVKLAGTLTIPAGSGRFPAAILLTGSGSQDRDETILGHKPFLVLADALRGCESFG